VVQVRVHGRGGQGVVTAAELLALAAFAEGRWAQAFPSFGSERTGAPVVAYCRIADSPIRLREPVVEPDAVIVQDATLLLGIDVFAGLRPDGVALVTAASAAMVQTMLDGRDLPTGERLAAAPASRIALEHVGRHVPNVPLLGAFAALTGVVAIESVTAAIEERFGGRLDLAGRNVAAARAAYELVLDRRAAGC
jgi:pyruvate ferredoxin oxidoreductase gamma subunit